MKNIKLFENFNNKSFDDIDSICKEFGIRNYSINPDGTVDVDNNVYIQNIGLKKIPIKFGKVTGHFRCDFNYLSALEGAPYEVGGVFNCANNKLTSLKGGPSRVGGNYWCQNNKLITLEGGPKEVHYFNCAYNPINKIYTWFPNYKSFIDSMDYSYLRGKTIDKLRFQEALDEIGIKLPESIPGYKYI